MLKQILGKIWRKMPNKARRFAVRLTQPSFTVSSGVIILNERNQILLLNHVLRPATGWGIPGGFLNAGEQPVAAARREIAEETGLELTDLQLVTAHTNGGHVEFIFVARTTGTPRVESREIIGWQWFALDEIPGEISRKERALIKQSFEIGEKDGLSYSVGN